MLPGAAWTRGLSGSRRLTFRFSCSVSRRSYSSVPDPAPTHAPEPVDSTPKSDSVQVRGRTVRTSSTQFNVSQNVLDATSRQLHIQKDHPIDITRRLIELHFPQPAFSHLNDCHPVVSTKENFDSLGFPSDHPGRARTDTYYFNDEELLRTHTSAHQAAAFAGAAEGQVGYVISADVYRRDEVDRKHYPVFHQMEGARWWDRAEAPDGHVATAIRHDAESLPCHDFAVEDSTPHFHPERNPLQEENHSPDEVGAVATHLKRSLENAIGGLFSRAKSQPDNPLRMRWVESYFPFTSPSWELEVYHDGDWMEVLGCGIVKHQLHAASGRPSRLGWAFGLGLDRIAMLLFRIPDIRFLWSTDERFLNQFTGMSLRPPEELQPFLPFSKHPPCPKDVSFWLPRGVAVPEVDVAEVVRTVARDVVEQVECFDRFTHPTTGQRSEAYRVTYRSLDRTLTNMETNNLHQKVKMALREQLGVSLR
ncbi:hypothetical protein XA68_14157 [Ophiocordyceps unilateralis]|uniref:Phenylalanine--tRNA ligase, mitochondrial n=1 Tax=Ophiocordyceps unilateralis TaxID=268505 RepID=A0A2A9PN31_OPHUN|nr:hypothetical protein XA68_14157 [Ophiocordyceps unilateralis]